MPYDPGMNNATNNTAGTRVTVQITALRLAEISERDAGYTVDIFNDARTSTERATNIRFRRHAASGRRNRSVVEMDLDGRPAEFNSDAVLFIAD